MYFEVNASQNEMTQHITEDFPLAIYQRTLNQQQQDTIIPHWHKEFQFIWVIEGTLNYSIEAHTVPLSSSSGILINSSKLHSAKPLSKKVDYLCIDFSPLFINELFYQKIVTHIQQQTNFIFTSVQLNTRQAAILKEIISSPNNLNYFSIYELLLGILSQVKTDKRFFEKRPLPIYELLDFVHANYQKQLSVDDIAQSIPINKNKCTALFNQYTQLSPINYVIDFRLNKAKELLQTTDYSISEICYSVGFNNISYFITKFKQKYHCTPLKFRKQFN